MSAQVTETAHGSLGLGVDDLLAMHRTMLTARLIDEAALRQNRMGRAPFVVPVSGHEGCQIGTAWPMRPGIDIWVPYYRDLGVVLVAGMTPEQIFLGVFSKATDPTSGGRQMPSHWSSRELGIVSHSSPISTQVPHAAGIAYAMKFRNEDAVVASWFGEGATSEGDWHEGLNIASIHRLPVVFICENNEYAISVPQSKQMAVADVASRADGYGIPGFVVDGNDVLAVHAVTGDAVTRARRGEGPSLLECKTYRWHFHAMRAARPPETRPAEEIASWKAGDPVARMEQHMVGRAMLAPDELRAIRDQVTSELDDAVAFADASPFPDPKDLMADMFAP